MLYSFSHKFNNQVERAKKKKGLKGARKPLGTTGLLYPFTRWAPCCKYYDHSLTLYIIFSILFFIHFLDTDKENLFTDQELL